MEILRWMERVFDTCRAFPKAMGHVTPNPAHTVFRSLRSKRIIQMRTGISEIHSHFLQGLLLPFEASLLTGGRDHDPIDRFLRFIDHHIDSHTCEVGHVADQIGISPSYLRETVRHRYGTTPSRMIEKKKIERAVRLMADPELTLCHVAVMSGYALERSFRKAFRKRLNATPSDVRRAILNSQDSVKEVERWLARI